MPRLKNKAWFLTKHVRTFRSDEMRDLEFEPAIPPIARTLLGPEGAVAAPLLSQCGTGAVPVLIAACQSSDPTERINASAVAGWPRDPRFIEPLLKLLNDKEPIVRYNALNGVALNWNSRFIEPVISLLRDEHIQIRSAATQCLWRDDQSNRQVYLSLLRDADPDVQSCALRILSRSNSTVIPRSELVRLLGAPRMQTVSLALSILSAGGSPLDWQSGPSPFTKPTETKARLTSEEAAPLTTNRITLARLTGLKILNDIVDAKAVELILPLLHDTTAMVRHRSFAALHTITGQNISDDDPAKWEAWWAVNKASFTPRRPAQ
jgi:HEAT repeat protein